MNFRTLDLNLLRVFGVVMVERNVTRAAARLSMTQPAVSNALRRLREAIGEDLFIPSSSGVKPTPYAQTLWPSVRLALDELRLAFDPQDFDPQSSERTFTVAMADATAALIVPEVVKLLSATQSLVDMRLLPLSTRDPRPMLDQGEADAAIGFFPEVAAAQAADGGTGATRLDSLYSCRYVCVMRRDHPLAREGALTLDAYCEAKHLRVSFAGRPKGFVDEALALLGRERRVMITVNQFFTAGCVVHKSDLLTALPLSFLPAAGFADDLVWRPLPLEVRGIDVGLLWHRRHERDAAQRWLRETLTHAAKTAVAKTPGRD
jgi:DNA-binding transcriptional LysR family regulator